MSLIIYTNNIVISYDIVFSGTVEELAQALDEGLVLLTTKEGNKVLINPEQAVSIEIKNSPLN
jgi:hypothetical protein|nr:MAG TPA: Protein of unknown function (DUF3107) [Caudoviricetes sp.]